MKLPTVVVVRDRLTYLEGLLEALAIDDHVGTIHLCDMASSWPPMIAQLDRWEAASNPKIRVHRIGQNLGAVGLFRTSLLRRLVGREPFLLTDEDVIPERPATAALLQVLLKHPRRFAKVGVSLRIDDLPAHYPSKDRVIQWEQRHWTHPIHPSVSYAGSVLYDADVATTFCVFRSLDAVNGDGDGVPACRVGPPFLARHMPWYEDPKRLPPDVEHFYKHAPLRRWGVAEPGVSWRPW